MQWNFGSIIDYISDLIAPGVPLSDAHTTLVKNLINVAVGGIAITFPINELKLPDHYVRAAADHSTGTVTATNGSYTVTGSGVAWTYKMIGRKIAIDGERTYYTIADVAWGAESGWAAAERIFSITLDRPYNGTGGAGLAYNIFENTFDLPEEIGGTGWIKGVFDPNRNFWDIEEVSWDWIDEQDPAFQATGQVDKYALPGNKSIREPREDLAVANLSGTTLGVYEMTTSTTTTSVVVGKHIVMDAIVSPHEMHLKNAVATTDDNYYKDWVLVNITQEKTSKITGYTASTNTLTLEEAITDQASGDYFYLLKNAPQITFYRRPTSVLDYLVKGYKATPKLLNLYDIPLLSEDFLDLIAAEVMTIYLGKDELAKYWEKVAEKSLDLLKNKYAKKTDSRQREGMFKKTGRLISFAKQES